jgi:isochorismate synthase EntC
MKTTRVITFDNPHREVTVDVYASAVAQALEARYPAFADEFLGLFSHTSEEGTTSIVAVGSELSIECHNAGDALELRLVNGEAVERECSCKLDPEADFHEQLFRAVAAFVDEIRPFLARHHGLPPSTLLLGGWRCGIDPKRPGEALVFTIPRVACRLAARECSFTHFESGDLRDVGARLVTFPYEFSLSANPRVTKRQLIPECREYVDALVGLIRELSGEAEDKVVIGREVRLTLQTKISPILLLRLTAPARGKKYEYVFRWRGGDSWVGVSPETLLIKQGADIVVEPLAGTRKGSDAREKSSRYREELLRDAKETEEHETAARMFHENLSAVCVPGSIQRVESRNVIDLGYVQHLKSTITGTVKPGMNVFGTLSAVYPPATIWGKPIALSGQRIRAYEKIDRGFYTGAFGYFTLDDSAKFALAIRTAKMSGNDIHVYAGSGIVKGSDPYREWLETSLKMSPFLASEFLVG